MTLGLYAAAITAGLLGGLHCITMCGGVASALKIGQYAQPRKVIAIASTSQTVRVSRAPASLMYHLGRISTYTLLGVLAATFSQQIQHGLSHMQGLQTLFFLLVQITLMAVGLQLLLGRQVQRVFLPLEKMAAKAWQYTTPLTRYLLPADRLWRNLLLGLIWGAVPCTLVYSALLLAMLASNGWQGGMVMLLFGVATLPHWLLGLASLQRVALPQFRRFLGLLTLLAGCWGLAQASTLSAHHGLWCL